MRHHTILSQDGLQAISLYTCILLSVCNRVWPWEPWMGHPAKHLIGPRCILVCFLIDWAGSYLLAKWPGTSHLVCPWLVLGQEALLFMNVLSEIILAHFWLALLQSPLQECDQVSVWLAVSIPTCHSFYYSQATDYLRSETHQLPRYQKLTYTSDASLTSLYGLPHHPFGSSFDVQNKTPGIFSSSGLSEKHTNSFPHYFACVVSPMVYSNYMYEGDRQCVHHSTLYVSVVVVGNHMQSLNRNGFELWYLFEGVDGCLRETK